MGKRLFFNSSNKMSRIVSFMLAFVIAFVPMAFNFPTKVEAATALKVYPAPAGVPLNTAYTVKVRVPGGTWQDLDEYRAIVDNYNPHSLSFVNFDTDGPVEMSVTFNSGTITTAVIRPTNKNIIPTINGNTMTFTVPGPMNLSAMVNGDEYNTVDIFANPVEVNPPSPNDPNVIYVGPGYYTGDYVVPSGKTLYIAGGAAIKGSIILDNATNAKVMGRGVLDRPWGRAVSANYANQITVEGIVLNDYGDGNNGGNAVHMAGSTNVTIENVKAYSYKKWTDGIDTFNSSYISMNNIFMRTADDAVAIYGTRANGGSVYGGLYSSHISVTNSILAQDTAHPINIGTHGDPTLPGGGGIIENLSFSNLDIWSYHQSLPISVTASDGLLVNDVTFTDIRIDDHAPGRIVDLLTFNNAAYGLGPGRGVNNVYFKNIYYTGSNANSNQIYGYNAERVTQNVTFENLQVNGNVITSASAGNFSIGNYASSINFIPAGGSAPAPTATFPYYTPTNLALNKTASSDSAQAGNPASSGNDGSTTTRWSANDGNTGHTWTVDLGSVMNITGGTQVMWGTTGAAYQYKIETSNDNTNWTLKADKTSNTDMSQVQTDLFLDFARYVRITVTGMPSGAWASFYDFKVLCEPLNLARGKTASADSTKTGSQVYYGNDGNPTTLWSANDGNTGHSFTVDLGFVKNIAYGTQVMWPNSGAAYKYKIETSNDNVNWTLKVDKTGNTDTNQVQNDLFNSYARYVRITITGIPSGAWASFYDFKALSDPINLALGKKATSDSSLSGYPASNGTDGSTTTRWSAGNGYTGHWWKVDLGTIMNINGGTQVMWEKIGAAYQYKIETSTDNINWTLKVDKPGNGNAGQVQGDYDYFTGPAQYVRITVTGMPNGAWASFYDFKVFGDTADNATMAQLQFDEPSGTIAADSTGNNWNGTLVGGANRVSGKIGSTVDLSGSSQYVALPAGAVSNLDKITLAAWVNLDTVSNWTRIFDFGSGTQKYMFLTPKNAANGKIRFAITKNGYPNEQIIDGQAALPTGGWHHVAVTLSGSTGLLYVDGVQVGSNTTMTIKPSDLGITSQNWIGRSQFPDPYLDGRVDDFRIYNRALTASEVTHVMNGQTGLPIAELPFNETSGTTANDVSGNGWNGTLTGGAAWAAGNSGNAVDLDGTNGYVALPAGAVSSAETITFATWVNLDSVSTWSRIFDFGSGTSKYMFLTPKNGENGAIRFEIKNGNAFSRIDGTAALAAGGWHHVAVTLDGATGTLYVDGQKVGSNSTGIRPSHLGVTTQNWIGRSQFPDPYLDGRVDDFRIINRALSAAEVAGMISGEEPTIPTAVSAVSAGGAAIQLDWAASLNAASYNIKRATVSGGPYTTIASVANPGYTDTGLTAGTTYYYVISAVSPGYESANSQEVFKAAGIFAGNQDIGSTGLAGSTAYTGAQTVLQGSGADIWGTADAFQFAYSPVTGDQTIIARVNSQSNTNAWAKAGLMIRESLDANAKSVMVAITPSNGVTFQYRAATGGSTSFVSTTGPVAPYWLKLVRSGNTFTSYISSDGTTWTSTGSTTVSMASNVYIGLAVSSHDTTKLSTVVFDNVTLN